MTAPTDAGIVERSAADKRAEIARKRNIDRLCRLKSDPLFFDYGLGEVFTHAQFERSMKL